MTCRRAGASAAAAIVLAAAPARADDWPLIDVKARLANDGRVTVVETHQVVFRTTGKQIARDFGLGADQSVRMTAVTRIGPDDLEHPLRAVEAVDDPDEYRHFDRGHLYLRVPELGEEVSLAYRFEYELAGGIAPVWGIAAGPASRASGDQALVWPWVRAGQVIDDWRRAWPKLGRRYRYDHDVLFPDREPGHTFRQIDYQLAYDTAWRDAEPGREIGEAVPSGAFRTAKVYDYLGAGAPVHAASAAAAERLLALAVVPLAGVAGWLLVVIADRRRRRQPVDRTFVEQRFLARAPEEIAFWFEDRRPTIEGILARLAGEGAITVQVDPPRGGADDLDGPLRLSMRRVAPDANLTAFERTVLDEVFGPDRELTTASHERRHRGTDYDPADGLAAQIAHLARIKRGDAGTRPRRATGWNAPRVAMALVLAYGLAVVFQHVGPAFDVVPIGGICAFFMIALVNAWPTGWWHPDLPMRGLIASLVLLYAMQLGWLLMPNRPLPSPGWMGMALAALAGYFLTLARARMPAGEGGVIADLSRMRSFAARELKQPRPQLDDRWIPRLRALGLGAAIDRWRERRRAGFAAPPEGDARPLVTSATFTGVGPAPFTGPDGWAESLALWAEDDPDAADDGAEAAETATPGSGRRSEGR
jgi:hypothetical protein